MSGNEWAYVKECLDTGWVSSVGGYVDRFEKETAEFVGVRHAIATVNGTAALHVALLVAGVQPGDEVLVSTLTFIAPANAIRYVGAWPVFIDAEADYWQMDPDRVAIFLEHDCRPKDGGLVNRHTGRRVAAILPVDILGHPVQAGPIVDLARKYGLAVVEDATEGLGARYRDRKVGALGDVACLSFNGNKIITTGGGGMILTDDEAWAQKARHLTTQAKEDPLEYVHKEIGFNYRLTNVLAAIGVAQLEQLDAYVARKREIAARYTQALAGVPGISVPREAPWARSTFWLYTILVDAGRFGMGSRDLLRQLQRNGIQSRPLWQPMHRSAAHEKAWWTGGEVADRLNREALSLPCSVSLTPEDQAFVLERLRDAANGRLSRTTTSLTGDAD